MDAKYQKLAAEYAKVKSQLSVLKNAIVEEKSRWAELEDRVKSQDLQLRKTDQEIDSLKFRNHQLTKRVAVLLEELNSKSSKHSKEKAPNSAMHVNLSVFDEELQKKIMENAQLTNELMDKKLEMSSQSERIRTLEEQLKHVLDKTLSDEKEISLLKAAVAEKKAAKPPQEAGDGAADQLQGYFRARLDEVERKLQLETSRADLLAAECQALEVRLEAHVEEKERLHFKLSDLQTTLVNTEEEAALTSRNYELQLSTMSEHLADLNDKMTAQSEHIQQLEAQFR